VGGRTGSGDPTRRRRRARVRMCFHFRSRVRLRGPTGRVDSVSMFLCLLHGRRDAGLDGMAAGGRLVATGQRRGRSRARATTPVAMWVGRRAGGRPQPRRPTRKHAAVGCPRPSTVWPCPRSPHTKEKKISGHAHRWPARRRADSSPPRQSISKPDAHPRVHARPSARTPFALLWHSNGGLGAARVHQQRIMAGSLDCTAAVCIALVRGDTVVHTADKTPTPRWTTR